MPLRELREDWAALEQGVEVMSLGLEVAAGSQRVSVDGGRDALRAAAGANRGPSRPSGATRNRAESMLPFFPQPIDWLFTVDKARKKMGRAYPEPTRTKVAAA